MDHLPANETVKSSGSSIPIASLDPSEAPPANNIITAVVALLWPYSSSTRTVAFLLREPDARLRRQRGQVRVQAKGYAATAVAKSGISIGDTVELHLDGAQWAEETAHVKTPGRSIEKELLFRKKILLSFRKSDGDVRSVTVDEPVSPPPSSPLQAATLPIEPSTPLEPRPSVKRQPTISHVTPFRLGVGVPLNSFTDDVDDFELEERPRKRVRTSGLWRIERAIGPPANEATKTASVTEEASSGHPSTSGLATSWQPSAGVVEAAQTIPIDEPRPAAVVEPSAPLDDAIMTDVQVISQPAPVDRPVPEEVPPDKLPLPSSTLPEATEDEPSTEPLFPMPHQIKPAGAEGQLPATPSSPSLQPVPVPPTALETISPMSPLKEIGASPVADLESRLRYKDIANEQPHLLEDASLGTSAQQNVSAPAVDASQPVIADATEAVGYDAPSNEDLGPRQAKSNSRVVQDTYESDYGSQLDGVSLGPVNDPSRSPDRLEPTYTAAESAPPPSSVLPQGEASLPVHEHVVDLTSPILEHPSEQDQAKGVPPQFSILESTPTPALAPSSPVPSSPVPSSPATSSQASSSPVSSSPASSSPVRSTPAEGMEVVELSDDDDEDLLEEGTLESHVQMAFTAPVANSTPFNFEQRPAYSQPLMSVKDFGSSQMSTTSIWSNRTFVPDSDSKSDATNLERSLADRDSRAPSIRDELSPVDSNPPSPTTPRQDSVVPGYGDDIDYPQAPTIPTDRVYPVNTFSPPGPSSSLLPSSDPNGLLPAEATDRMEVDSVKASTLSLPDAQVDGTLDVAGPDLLASDYQDLYSPAHATNSDKYGTPFDITPKASMSIQEELDRDATVRLSTQEVYDVAHDEHQVGANGATDRPIEARVKLAGPFPFTQQGSSDGIRERTSTTVFEEEEDDDDALYRKPTPPPQSLAIVSEPGHLSNLQPKSQQAVVQLEEITPAHKQQDEPQQPLLIGHRVDQILNGGLPLTLAPTRIPASMAPSQDDERQPIAATQKAPAEVRSQTAMEPSSQQQDLESRLQPLSFDHRVDQILSGDLDYSPSAPSAIPATTVPERQDEESVRSEAAHEMLKNVVEVNETQSQVAEKLIDEQVDPVVRESATTSHDHSVDQVLDGSLPASATSVGSHAPVVAESTVEGAHSSLVTPETAVQAPQAPPEPSAPLSKVPEPSLVNGTAVETATPRKRTSIIPDAISTWFTAGRKSLSSVRISGKKKPPKEESLGATASVRKPVEVGFDFALSSGTVQSTPDKGALTLSSNGLAATRLPKQHMLTNGAGHRTTLAYYTPLTDLERLLNYPSQTADALVDVMAVVSSPTSKPERAKAGPKDYFTLLQVTDRSVSNKLQVQIFRPFKHSLPVAETGDVVILRNFVVKSNKYQVYLLSTETSAWHVWHFDQQTEQPMEECKGPPVEVGEQERQYVLEIRKRWLDEALASQSASDGSTHVTTNGVK